VHGTQLCRKGEIDASHSGSSALESPEKVRGIEESNDNFRIEFEDYELQQEEMEEMEEMEKEKENEKEMEEEQKKEEGELALTFLKPPLSHQQGLLVLPACQKIMLPHILAVFAAVSKFHEMNIYA
jgi:hypothetical protein